METPLHIRKAIDAGYVRKGKLVYTTDAMDGFWLDDNGFAAERMPADRYDIVLCTETLNDQASEAQQWGVLEALKPHCRGHIITTTSQKFGVYKPTHEELIGLHEFCGFKYVDTLTWDDDTITIVASV
jgi:hypothetical protein